MKMDFAFFQQSLINVIDMAPPLQRIRSLARGHFTPLDRPQR